MGERGDLPTIEQSQNLCVSYVSTPYTVGAVAALIIAHFGQLTYVQRPKLHGNGISHSA